MSKPNAIRFLRITRFRGINTLEWHPAPGGNIIVGPSDSGKTTILEALALLLSSVPATGLSEFDYLDRDIEKGFRIEAVLALGDPSSLDIFPPILRGWTNGQLTDLPDEDGAEPVLVCRLSGTPELEAVYELVGPDDSTAPFSRRLRQRVGLLRLGIADRWDRDLRLVQGGALDRYLEGEQLRQTIVQAVLKTPIHDQLDDQPKKALERIEKEFKERNLPNPVRLGLIGTPGVSIAASAGLMIGSDGDAALPLPGWGTGTRRLATLALASIVADSMSLALIDEPEFGLEPYRQRSFVTSLLTDSKRQSFITTHSPAILSASKASGAAVWRANDNLLSHILAALNTPEVSILIEGAPEAVLSKMPVICEGVTEVGFATQLLEHRFGIGYSTRGVFCLDAGGHDRALPICQCLLAARYRVAAIVDDEGRKSGSWAQVENDAILLQWSQSMIEHAVLEAIPDAHLPGVVSWPEECGGKEERHCLADVREALDMKGESKPAQQLLDEVGRDRFLKALFQAACPPRQGNKKPKGWFKSFEGGRLLAGKLHMLAVKPNDTLKRVEKFLDEIAGATIP